MARRKYTPEIQRNFVEKYMREGWASRNQFAKAKNLTPSLFNRWCLEYESGYSKKPTFASVQVSDESKQIENNAAVEAEEEHIELAISCGNQMRGHLRFTPEFLGRFFRRRS